MAIQYVGGTNGSRNGNSNATTTQSLTSLTGGIASAPAEGDIVIVVCVAGSQTRNSDQAISGYNTLGTQLNPNAVTYDTSLQVSWKRMTATPDTSITIPAQGNAADGQSWAVMVFRGVDPTTAFDVTSVSATGTATGRFDAAAITPTTAGAWIVIAGGGAAAAGATYTAPTGFTDDWLTDSGADTNDSMVGMGYYTGWTSGEYNPAAVTGGTTGANDSWASWTMALRPNLAQTLTQSSSFTNTNTYYTHQADLVLSASALFNNTNSFYSHTAAAGGVEQSLTQSSRFDNSNTYYTHSTTLTLIQGAWSNAWMPDDDWSLRLGNSNAFYSHTLTPGTVILTASLYTNTPTYYAHTLTTGEVTLTASRYDNDNTYYTHLVSAGAVEQGLTANLYTNDPVYYGHTLTTGEVTLTASRYDNDNTFFAHSVDIGAVTLTADRYDNSQTFYEHTLQTGPVTLTADLYSNTNTFYEHVIPGQDIPLTADRYDNSVTFYTHDLVVGEVTLVPDAYTNDNTFYEHSINSVEVLTSERFDNTQTFYVVEVLNQYPDPSSVRLGVKYGEPGLIFTGTNSGTLDKSPKLDLISGRLIKPLNNKVVISL